VTIVDRLGAPLAVMPAMLVVFVGRPAAGGRVMAVRSAGCAPATSRAREECARTAMVLHGERRVRGPTKGAAAARGAAVPADVRAVLRVRAREPHGTEPVGPRVVMATHRAEAGQEIVSVASHPAASSGN
jgi:hypothetical protein